ncbi:MAG: HEAT repeat domain-containing protein, partial [Planctomycetota bacterium]
AGAATHAAARAAAWVAAQATNGCGSVLIGAVLVLAGCAGSGSSARVRKLDELPTEYRVLWKAWLSDQPDWAERREVALWDPRLTEFLVDNLARAMLATYGRSRIASPGSAGSGVFERSQAELVSLGQHSVPTLIELTAIGDGATAFLCTSVLQRIGRPALAATAELLERDAPQARQRAAELLGKLPHGRRAEPELRAALIRHLREDPHWMTRASCAESLGRRGARDVETESARVALCLALGDEEPEVARSATVSLVRLDDPAAIPALINHLQRTQVAGEVTGNRLAQASLRGLSHTTQNLTPRQWRSWWRENRPAPGRRNR